MEERRSQSIMCSVLFLSIVEYSRKPVAAQIALKECFNAVLSGAIREVPVNDRIILDTGDGAAICFLGNIEDALKVALYTREGLRDEGAACDPPLLVRLGINMGPVRMVKDENGQPNVVGDGINVALRVMGFSSPGQIMVSRSYHDAVSQLSQKYAGMFRHEGSRTDRHVREHELYAVVLPNEFATTQQYFAHGTAPVNTAAASQHAAWQLRALYAGVLAVLLIVALVKIANRSTVQSPEVQALPAAEAPARPVASQPAAVEAAAPPAKEAAVTVQKPEVLPPPAVGAEQAARSAQQAPENVPAGSLSSGQEKPAIQIAPGAVHMETPAAAHEPMGRVNIAVTPWGEVYVDGKMRGISPPLVELQLAPGKHKIEIRNMAFPAYTQNIQIKAGERIKIRHKFAN